MVELTLVMTQLRQPTTACITQLRRGCFETGKFDRVNFHSDAAASQRNSGKLILFVSDHSRAGTRMCVTRKDQSFKSHHTA
jgi:hypothetical protein